MLVSLLREQDMVAKPFLFKRMLGTHDAFLSLVNEVWSMHVDGCPMFQISKKLKPLKCALRKWNIEVFGRVEVELQNLENHIVELENSVSTNYSTQAILTTEAILFDEEALSLLLPSVSDQ
ncbi:hypothetical protein F2P56_032815 [Juglans regia]|uniref:Uncharacterized protein n=1 Tax=Juglans regia TaxID=51240 RepID=A0A833WV93_JUGRE|nr:hypothetical protein F2P56_032815 [Juglans regia]